jgi:hypothetical protein
LETPPKEWKDITIDKLTMKLPLSEYSKVGGKENFIRFISGTEYLLVSDIGPSKEIQRMTKFNRVQQSQFSRLLCCEE